MTTLLSNLDRDALGRTVYPPLDAATRAACLIRVKRKDAILRVRKGAFSDLHLGELVDGADAGRAVALKLMRFMESDDLVPEDIAAAVRIFVLNIWARGSVRSCIRLTRMSTRPATSMGRPIPKL